MKLYSTAGAPETIRRVSCPLGAKTGAVGPQGPSAKAANERSPRESESKREIEVNSYLPSLGRLAVQGR